jgi:AMMECR1 domain-containing protein
MARPRRKDNEQSTASVRAGLTDAEKVYLQDQAAKAGLSEAEYTRRRILGYAVPSASSRQRTDPVLINELNRIGVNVNQLSRAVHTDREFVKYWHDIGEELKRVLAKVLQTGED